MQKWPLHPPPQKAESLGSWVQRLGQAYGYSFASMVSALGWDNYTYTTLELELPYEGIDFLSKCTGIPTKTIQNRTFSELVKRDSLDLFDSSEYHKSPYMWRHSILCSPEILRLTDHSYSLQSWHEYSAARWPRACPKCLEMRPQYRRIYWSFPLMMSCPIHGEFLRPLFVRQMQVSMKEDLQDVPKELHLLDCATYGGILTGKVRFHGVEISLARWLSIIRNLICELSLGNLTPKPEANLLNAVWRRAEHRPRDPYRLPFERLRFNQQIRYMRAVAAALDVIVSGEVIPLGAHAHLLQVNK